MTFELRVFSADHRHVTTIRCAAATVEDARAERDELTQRLLAGQTVAVFPAQPAGAVR